MRHILTVLVENKAGVLARIAGLFSRRGFNIESLSVSPTQDATISRMTIVATGDDIVLEQINKQLNKLINVIKIIDLTSAKFIDRELALIKVSVDSRSRSEIMQITDIFRGRIVDVAEKSIIVEITGDEEKIAALVEMLKRFGIKELVRTGKVALLRG
jgi:acetolactate synthase-1/3 small subunit